MTMQEFDAIVELIEELINLREKANENGPNYPYNRYREALVNDAKLVLVPIEQQNDEDEIDSAVEHELGWKGDPSEVK